MKILNILTATALAVSALGASTAALAQPHHEGSRDRHDGGRRAGWQNVNDHRDYGRDHNRNGKHNGWNNHRRCHTEWRHHHKVRICR